MARKNRKAIGRNWEREIRDWIAEGHYNGEFYHCEIMPTVKFAQQDFWKGAFDIQCSNERNMIMAQVKWQANRLPPKLKTVTDKMKAIPMPHNVAKILVRVDGRTGEKVVDIIT